VLALNPYAARLATRQRANRAARAIAVARARLDRCAAAPAPSAPSPQLEALAKQIESAGRLRISDLQKDADALDSSMAVVFDVEKLSLPSCPAPTTDDRALQLIDRQRASVQ
jgi:hypothetical protein